MSMTDPQDDPNQIFARLQGQHGPEARLEAWRYMLTVYVQATMSLTMVMGVGSVVLRGTQATVERSSQQQ